MKFIFSILMLYNFYANAVILVPGKIEDPKRADLIMAQKIKAKKDFLAKRKIHFKQQYALKKQQLATQKIAATAAAPTEGVQSKEVNPDGTPIIEPTRQLQEVKESAN